MSKTSQETRRELTEERGKELDKWWKINFLRYMKFQEPISPTLSDMPTEILVQVLEKLNSIEQLTCRKVCRSLRSTVQKFEIYFAHIWFHVWNDHVTMHLGSSGRIIYSDAANGSSIVTYNKKETMIKGENFMQVAFNDLGILLKRVREFEFVNFGIETHAIITTLLNVLKTNQCVQVKKIKFWCLALSDICSILPHFDSKMLESIHLNCEDTNEHSELLAQLEQWKNSTECKLYGSLGDNIPIQHLLHFKNITVLMKEFSLQKMIEIRDVLLKRSTLEECNVNLEDFNQIEIAIEVARVFQPHYCGSGEFEIEYSCNNDKFNIRCGIFLELLMFNIKRW